jgi:hypothetical protein
MPRTGPSLALALALLAACEASPAASPCASTQLLPAPRAYPVDLLLVVDESPAMAGQLERLDANLRRFAARLAEVEGGLPDLHVGLVSADPARAGVLQAGGADAAACGVQGGARWLRASVTREGQLDANFDGTLADTLACLGHFGSDGGPVAAPLAVAEAALAGALDPGFRRAGAALAILVVAAQDDCTGPTSPVDPFACTTRGVRCQGEAPLAPGSYAGCEPAVGPEVGALPDTLASLTAAVVDPALLSIGVVAGPAAPFVVGEGPRLRPSCSGDDGPRPAVRLTALASLHDHAATVSMCEDTWDDVLTPTLDRILVPLGQACLTDAAAVDLDAAAPGLQLDCAVADVQRQTTAALPDAPVPRCVMVDDTHPDPAGARPCWWVEATPLCDGAGLQLHVERGAASAGPYDFTEVRCPATCE